MPGTMAIRLPTMSSLPTDTLVPAKRSTEGPLAPCVYVCVCVCVSVCVLVFFFKVCREFQRGNCTRGEHDCRYAHPTDVSMIEVSDNTVTICMDYIKGRCSREKCKYFHPPAHLQAKLKAAHHQMNHSAATAMVRADQHLQPHHFGVNDLSNQFVKYSVTIMLDSHECILI